MPTLAQATANATCYKCGSSCNQEELRIHMLGKCPKSVSDLQKKTAKMLKSKGVETATTAAILREAAMQEIAKPNMLQKVLDKYKHNAGGGSEVNGGGGGGWSGPIEMRYNPGDFSGGISPIPGTLQEMYGGPANLPSRPLIQMILAPEQALNNHIGTFINKTYGKLKITIEELDDPTPAF